MKLLTKANREKLLKNGREQQAARGTGDDDIDFYPVVKFFNPCGAATWLFSELDEDGDTLFGLCDLGLDCVELGSASLAELSEFRGRFGLGIERDLHFKADKSLGDYAAEARQFNRIRA